MSAPADTFIVRGRRVVAHGAIAPRTVHVAAGVIVDVAGYDDVRAGVPVIDAGELAVLPGLVDSHVHINEPGRTHWEGFWTATRAAAAGGITTLIDMPLNSLPPVTTPQAFDDKRAAATGQLHVDLGLWGGVIPGNADTLGALVDRGALGFKCFLVDSGVPEFPNVTERDLDRALGPVRERGVPLLAHAELDGPIAAVAATLPSLGLDKASYQHHLVSRPPAAEVEAIELLVRLCRRFKTPIHVVHHSAQEGLALIEAAKDEGLPFSAETCPHYLSFAAEDIPDGATHFKCTPPIRGRDNNEALWRGLKRGVLTSVVSDHSPCSPALKKLEQRAFDAAWGGISSLQLTLSAVWTGASLRGATLVDLARWMSEAPAQLSALWTKGSIAKGKDADLVFFDDDASFTVDAARLFHKHALTPYQGREHRGVVKRTFLRGHVVYDAVAGVTEHKRGSVLLRGQA